MRLISLAATLATALLIAPAALATVQISSKPTANMTCAEGTCSPTAKKAVLNVDDLANMLASGDVTVTSGTSAKDIQVEAMLSWASAHRLTLDSFQSIVFNKSIVVTGTGALTITTNDGGSGGDFGFGKKGHVEFWDTNSGLIINGQNYVLAKNIQQIASQLKNGAGFVALAKGFDAKRQLYKHAPIDSLSGIVEGLGNTISDLRINNGSSSEQAALIGNILISGTARDIVLANVDIIGSGAEDQRTSSLAGDNDGTIVNVRVTGTITSMGDDSDASGLTGQNEGTIVRCSTNVAVSSQGQHVNTAGLVGTNYDEGSSNPGIVRESFSYGTVSANNAAGDNVNAGGLIGSAFGGNISDSYAANSVTAHGQAAAGGLIGFFEDGGEVQFVLVSSYSIGAVNADSANEVGGFAGGAELGGTDVGDDYWDLDTSGIGDPAKGIGNIANAPGVTGLSTEQFKSMLPKDLKKNVWRETAGINNGYPYLIANPPPQ